MKSVIEKLGFCRDITNIILNHLYFIYWKRKIISVNKQYNGLFYLTREMTVAYGENFVVANWRILNYYSYIFIYDIKNVTKYSKELCSILPKNYHHQMLYKD